MQFIYIYIHFAHDCHAGNESVTPLWSCDYRILNTEQLNPNWRDHSPYINQEHLINSNHD